MDNLYCCYSVNQRNFLTKNNINYEICALNPNSKNMFWVYVRTENLTNLLNEWNKKRKNKF